MNSFQRIFIVFAIAFALNLIWENLHSVLYDNYMGGNITERILLQATFIDAIIIALLFLPYIVLPKLKIQPWFIILFGFIISILIELWAIEMGVWSYNSLMPIIPIIKIGLTPTIQLGLLGYLALTAEKHIFAKITKIQ